MIILTSEDLVYVMLEVVDPWQVIQVSELVSIAVLGDVNVNLAAVFILDPVKQSPNPGREHTEPTGGATDGKKGEISAVSRLHVL